MGARLRDGAESRQSVEPGTRLVTVSSLDQLLRDFHPRPGERIKQYVVDMRREDAWEDATCPTFNVDPHTDNTGAACRNVGSTQYRHLAHDCCAVCDELHEKASRDPAAIVWNAERAERPAICEDEAQLSDELEPNRALAPHPVFAMLRKECDEANAAMDAKEAALDKHGYGGPRPAGEIVGLEGFAIRKVRP